MAGEVKRYDFGFASVDTVLPEMIEESDGDYMLFVDHQSALTARDQTIAELRKRILELEAQLRRIQTGNDIESDMLTEHEIRQQAEIGSLKELAADALDALGNPHGWSVLYGQARKLGVIQ